MRMGMLEELKAQKDEILEWSSEAVDKKLGKPDAKDLDKRTRLYYIYNIKGGVGCDQDSSRIYLQIRFNSINRADEITLFE